MKDSLINRKGCLSLHIYGIIIIAEMKLRDNIMDKFKMHSINKATENIEKIGNVL